MAFRKIIRILNEKHRFLITTHVNPDADGICSELAMAEYLRSLGKGVVVVNEEELPQRYRFLPGATRIKSYKEGMKIDYDAAIILDCGDSLRIGRVNALIKEEKILINIDHHITNDSFGGINLIRPEASSTAELIYQLLKEAHHPLNKRLAMYLYAGIMTDTGSFRFDNTTAATHKIAAELLSFDFSVDELYRRFYECVSIDDLRAFARLVSRFDVLFSGKLICLDLRKTVLAHFSKDFDIRNAIFRFLRAIAGVEVFVVFTEQARARTRVNLRSTGRVNVARLACYFKGGGHRKASGCTIYTGIKEARRLMLEQIEKVL